MADQTWGSYDFWYLMEGDSTPIKPYWMEQILDEAQFYEPFAILGSNFRGDLWDGFLNDIPFSLKHHANGNALYNSSHALMKWLTEQLAMSNSTDSSIAYDYRMAELIFGGNSSDFGYAFLSNFSLFGEMPYINYMSSISNYARTPMIPDFYGDEAVAHGAKNYENWNRSDHSISLVVSDFGAGSGSNFELMLNSIMENEHPFEEVIFVRSNGSELSFPSTYTLNNTKTGEAVQIIEVARNVSANASYPDFLDWCQANVSTDFFMYSNTFHKLVDPVFILQSKNSSEPYVPYVPADSDACTSYPECVYSVLQARNVSGLDNYRYHVLDTEMVFDTSIKAEFCLYWQAWHAQNFAEDECDPISGPTADDYLAYSMANSGISVEVNSKVKQGSKYIAVPHTNTPDDTSECSIFVNNMANSSTCGIFTDDLTCSDADGCYWRENFQRCVQNDNPNPLLFYSPFELLPRQADIAIVRPFAVSDYASLLRSFSEWNSFIPCNSSETVNADIFLVFSQDLDDYSSISSVIEDFLSEPDDWMRCFNSINAISAKISLIDDIYTPHQSHNNSFWANGPNRQFNFIAKAMADQTWGSYDFWYLMEGDSTPIKPYWMEQILDEAQFYEPFAILGSNFRGDLWDGFLNDIPFSLKHHANGNALYNSSHALMKWLTEQLAMSNSTDSSIAYDYRMAELIFGGNSSDFGYAFLSNFSLFGEMPYINYMSSISNYARTPMIPDFYGDEAVAHGAKNYENWNRSDHSISLVVSDFGAGSGSNFELMLNSIMENEHPFEEVIFVRSNGSELSFPSTYTLNNTKTGEAVQIIEVARNVSANASYPDFLDWCQANVSTDFFMYSNTFHKLVDPVFILQSKNSSEPYVPYVPADSDACTSYPECVYSVLQARNVSGLDNYRYHVLDTEMVFDTSIKAEFCLYWQAWHAQNFAEDECDPISGPTADDYLAYSMANSGISVEVNSKVKQGSKYIAVPHTNTPDDTSECSIFVNNMANSSTCGVYTTSLSCNVSEGCFWREHFDRCVANEDPNPLWAYDFLTSSPTSSPTAGPTASPTTASPTTASPTGSPTTSAPTPIYYVPPTPAPTTAPVEVEVEVCISVDSSSNISSDGLESALSSALESTLESSGLSSIANVTFEIETLISSSGYCSSERRLLLDFFALEKDKNERVDLSSHLMIPRGMVTKQGVSSERELVGTVTPTTTVDNSTAAPTIAPTMAPTMAPTLMPTSAPVTGTSAPTTSSGSVATSAATVSSSVSYTFSITITGSGMTDSVAVNISTSLEASVEDGSFADELADSGIDVLEVSFTLITDAPTLAPTAAPTLADTTLAPTSARQDITLQSENSSSSVDAYVIWLPILLICLVFVAGYAYFAKTHGRWPFSKVNTVSPSPEAQVAP